MTRAVGAVAHRLRRHPHRVGRALPNGPEHLVHRPLVGIADGEASGQVLGTPGEAGMQREEIGDGRAGLARLRALPWSLPRLRGDGDVAAAALRRGLEEHRARRRRRRPRRGRASLRPRCLPLPPLLFS